MNWRRLKEFLEDGQYLSATRLAFLVWSLGSFVLWSTVTVCRCRVEHHFDLAPLPANFVALLGIFAGGKVAQAFFEQDK